MRLKNKTAFITDAAQGIGAAIAAIYLAADESNFMTGSEIHIDGGILAGASASPKKAAVT